MNMHQNKDHTAPSALSNACGCTDGGCGSSLQSQYTGEKSSQWPRRDLLKLIGLGAAGMTLAQLGLPVMAGPFDASDVNPDHPIPLDKKLNADWVRSLYERGEPTVYAGWDQLKYIGMPIGGIGTGTVYLGGDGQLWCWDIFNQHHEGAVPNQVADFAGQRVRERDGANYVAPSEQQSPWNIDQGFALRVGDAKTGALRLLNHRGFEQIQFNGQYPIAQIDYADHDSPVQVRLEAMTPFIPLDADRSSYPASIMRFTLTNTSGQPQEAALVGWMENPALRISGAVFGSERTAKVFRTDRGAGVFATAQRKQQAAVPLREDIVFETFEREDWGDWRAQGEAFEGGPFSVRSLANHQRVSRQQGDRFVNSHNTRQDGDVGASDNLTGELVSPTFTISRRFINLLVAGGDRVNDAYIEVVVGGKSVAKTTGRNNNNFHPITLNVSQHEGEEARIRIVDQAKGGWGIILVDQIVFSDAPQDSTPVDDLPDFGSMALLMVDSETQAGVRVGEREVSSDPLTGASDSIAGPSDQKQVGVVQRNWRLKPGESVEATCIIAWHFPNARIPNYNPQQTKRWYASRFADARATANQVAGELGELIRLTRLWRDVWYDSTLPHWLLDRTLLTIDALQTNTCYRFTDGRFWAWEGVGCCAGTCTHVWHYAQAVGRLFPQLERDLRQRTDYGIALRESDGMIRFRGEFNGRDATDGQAGVILRTLREHQTSADKSFLESVWPRCKKALEFLIAQDARDGEPDGVPVGEQHNTLDAEWYGKVPVLASLYLAAIRAGEAMAREVGDQDFARQCALIHQRGRKNILELFDKKRGYFIQIEDPNHLDAIGVGAGCYIDQVMGQWWAFQLGLGRLYNEHAVRRTLQSLWDYNFCPDMGQLRASIQTPGLRGRPYAIAGDAGLVMCTWPKGGKRDDWTRHWQFGYFNECMTGFEYEAAGHMIWEGSPKLVEQGLAITRAIHDRYDARLRNPYNEVECSDHYARSMASYGVFLALCGYEYHGPKGHLGFAPRLTPENFKAPFTAAEGWGTFSQRIDGQTMEANIEIKMGELSLRTLSLSSKQKVAGVAVNGKPARFTQKQDRVLVTLADRTTVSADQSLAVKLIL